jgi:hypothetical protein
MRPTIALIVLLFATPVMAEDDPNDITCVALLSIGRDLAFQTGNKRDIRQLTDIQNKVILSKPHGAFPSSRIKKIKALYLKAPNVRIPLMNKCIARWQ